ncbi:hypothetical protein IQ244_23680 [Nostoc sp. LEGE 06077]|uniref:hypothetical protein n=1 Tax=Nostoc sp. LEGE 06077 TaxID=915325 RepID=UPI001881AFC6|nr:hypothetical protein [Nostoc sp. LEGE 06077]MBE9209443.1 hypothetical protein [Nostoc sp. LEGE 06077]
MQANQSGQLALSEAANGCFQIFFNYLTKFIQLVLAVYRTIEASRIIVPPEGVGLSMLRNVNYQYRKNQNLQKVQLYTRIEKKQSDG